MPKISEEFLSMADIVVTLRIMPKEKDTDLDKIKDKAIKLIKEFGGELGKEHKVEIAYGLKALDLIFIMDEGLGSTEELEEKIRKIKDVNSAEVTDVRRAIG